MGNLGIIEFKSTEFCFVHSRQTLMFCQIPVFKTLLSAIGICKVWRDTIFFASRKLRHKTHFFIAFLRKNSLRKNSLWKQKSENKNSSPAKSHHLGGPSWDKLFRDYRIGNGNCQESLCSWSFWLFQSLLFRLKEKIRKKGNGFYPRQKRQQMLPNVVNHTILGWNFLICAENPASRHLLIDYRIVEGKVPLHYLLLVLKSEKGIEVCDFPVVLDSKGTFSIHLLPPASVPEKVEVWAETSDRPFMMITGRTRATKFPNLCWLEERQQPPMPGNGQNKSKRLTNSSKRCSSLPLLLLRGL